MDLLMNLSCSEEKDITNKAKQEMYPEDKDAPTFPPLS